jgi:hypothetical protein
MESRTGNDDAKRYLAVWQSLPVKERIGHMPEQVCEIANVAPMDLVSWVSRQVFAEGSAKSNMCLSFMRDKVLEKSAKFAMQSPDNYKHAELFMKAGGLIAAGSGTKQSAPYAPVSIFNMPVAAATASTAVKTTNGGIKSMDEQIVDLSKIMQSGTLDCAAERIVDTDDDDDDDDEESE